jgi:hypothetical protein
MLKLSREISKFAQTYSPDGRTVCFVPKGMTDINSFRDEKDEID